SIRNEVPRYIGVTLWRVSTKDLGRITFWEQFKAMSLLTPSDIQHSATTQIWGCYRLVSEPRADNEEITDRGIPRVIVYGYDGLPMQPVAPPSPNYIPGPEDPQTPPVPQDEDVREPMITVRLQASISLPPRQGERLQPCYYHHPTPYYLTILHPLPLLVTTALPSPLLPPLPPSLYIPPPIDRRDDLLESELPPRKRLCLSTLGSKYEGISEVGYGIRDTWVDPAEAVPEIAPMTVTRISQRVAMDSQRADLLLGDRMTLQETIWIMEEEAHASREAWAYLIGLSQATHQELQTHRDHVYAHETHIQAHQAKMAALRETDHKRQAQMAETLRVMRDMRREISDMQAELLAHRE
ncbi:hypothetical protein Tco_1433936, partial [Tanacetum coccineum]